MFEGLLFLPNCYWQNMQKVPISQTYVIFIKYLSTGKTPKIHTTPIRKTATYMDP